MLDPKPAMFILDMNNKELFRFQTSTPFKFKDELPKEDTYELIYNLIMLAVDEFNEELKKCKNSLAVNREFKKETFQELYDDIERAFMANNVN